MTNDDHHGAAPGWDAITAALARLYPGAEPRFAAYPPSEFGRNLQGCSAYEAAGHWHYVTFGLTELWGKSPDDDPEFSGWGFELTFRLVRADDEHVPPGWPVSMLHQIATYINSQGMLLEAGQWIDMRGPITGFPESGGPETGLCVFVLADDPELTELRTPNGRVAFLQLVGVTEAERDGLTEIPDDPLMITDPSRA
ncbi:MULTISPECIES: suppressor of fused domain protein [Actinoplanes]|uniref:suppressor of fused domain protein n=1 Tax=Actinoplanes TaxID=1865 RepID=UPI001B80A394|nr:MULTISPECIES: suppressor of fused domain protein [Actinoplanes]